MLKFFRKIRQNLLKEGKTGKYMKYAIGEIVLVVVGILIAVQINAWHKNNQDQELKLVLTENLINDLTKDTIQINARIKENEDFYLANLDSVMAIIVKPETSLRDIELLGKKVGIDGLRILNKYNNNTFNILVSTGDFRLFEDSLVQKLMELNRLQHVENSVSDNNGAIYFELYNSYLKKYPNNITTLNDGIVDEIWANINTVEHASLFLHTKETQRHCVTRYIQLSKEVIAKTEELLEDLKKEAE